MFFMGRDGRSGVGATRFSGEAAGSGVRIALRVFAVAAAAATLAACAQSPYGANRSASLTRQAAPEPTRQATVRTKRPAVAALKKHTPFPISKPPTGQEQSHGLASFYRQGTQTANGETFNPNELTAAHRTLPFGTRLRVTNTVTGQSVTVRVNDRGPFVPGRVVDVSDSAAESLGIVGRGVAKVKLDVVE
jgi:rare lipoprotein A